MTTICNFCESEITKYNLMKHQKSEYCLKVNKLLLKKEETYKKELNEINNNLNLLNKELENKEKSIQEIKQENNILKQENNDLKNEIKHLKEKVEEYRKIVEKSATKTTIKNNYTHNNYLNYISSEPINFKNLKNELKDIVTTNSLMYDEDDFNEHIVDNILKDKNGKDKVLCTDINRKNFAYKDENSGELVYDPELDRLTEQLRKGVKVKQIRSELLEKLIDEYEENGKKGKDPYIKFYEIIQKLNFGNPFVEHVAKKTYIKSKNVLKD